MFQMAEYGCDIHTSNNVRNCQNHLDETYQYPNLSVRQGYSDLFYVAKYALLRERRVRPPRHWRRLQPLNRASTLCQQHSPQQQTVSRGLPLAMNSISSRSAVEGQLILPQPATQNSYLYLSLQPP